MEFISAAMFSITVSLFSGDELAILLVASNPNFITVYKCLPLGVVINIRLKFTDISRACLFHS